MEKKAKERKEKNSDNLKIISYVSFRDAGQQDTKCFEGKKTKENMIGRHATYNGVRQAQTAEVISPKRRKENTGEV
jgi:hypothetical protein